MSEIPHSEILPSYTPAGSGHHLEEGTYKFKAVMEPGGSGQGCREITWDPYRYRCPRPTRMTASLKSFPRGPPGGPHRQDFPGALSCCSEVTFKSQSPPGNSTAWGHPCPSERLLQCLLGPVGSSQEPQAVPSFSSNISAPQPSPLRRGQVSVLHPTMAVDMGPAGQVGSQTPCWGCRSLARDLPGLCTLCCAAWGLWLMGSEPPACHRG